MPAAEEKALADISEIPGLDGLALTGPNPETDNALDGFFTESTGKIPPKNKEEEFEADQLTEKEAKEAAEVVARLEAREAAEAKAKAEGAPPVDEAAEAAAKEKAKADAEAAEAVKIADEFDGITLPPYTKPKTAEAFDTVKKLAREKVLALQKDLETANAKAKELEDKGNGKLDPAVQKELDDLRKFRSKIDVEADPAFLAYDSKVAGNIESIYAKLAEFKTPPEAIAKIKELGGPEQVDWESVKMGPQLRRFIETKLANNMDLVDQKKAALDEAKKNSTEYLKTRRADFEKTTVDESKAVAGEIQEMTKEFSWASPKQAKSGADEVETKAVEAHNALAKDIKEMMAEAISDPSPRMRALLALGTAQFVNLRAEHAKLKQTYEAETTKLKKELEESKAFIEKVKKGSTNRLRDTPATLVKEPGRAKAEFNENASDAMDRHLKELQGATA